MKESRRDFLKKSGYGVGALTVASQLGRFGLMGNLASANAQASPLPGYKALVLIFLAGGNDGNNLVVPKHGDTDAYLSSHAEYLTARGALGIPHNELHNITVPRMGNRLYGLHPSLNSGVNGGLHDLWIKGKMAIVANVGNLAEPLSRAQYLSGYPRPASLFSHSDQIEQNQTCSVTVPSSIGWGARLRDQVSYPPSAPLPMLTSIAGSQLVLNGGTEIPLVIADGATPLETIFRLDHIDETYVDIDGAFKYLVKPSPSPSPAPSPSKLVDMANEISDRAVKTRDSLICAGGPGMCEINGALLFPNTGIGKQLLQVARLVQLSAASGVRQIFFCQLGGFDTHAYQMTSQAALLTQLSQAVSAFYKVIDDNGFGEAVTTFTMSDFSRTLKPNGEGAATGSDHAWGNHMMVMGGKVNGGNFYGVPPNTFIDHSFFPKLVVNDGLDSDSGQHPKGRWIPTTSTEEYLWQLAKWFGLGAGDRLDVFPNFGPFSDPQRETYLQFMNP